MKTEIRNVNIIDGRGTPGFIGSILIEKDKIHQIDKESLGGDTVIDGKNLIACPGFIDVHTHVDFGFYSEDFLAPMLTQGITTIMGMNCGLGIYPFDPFIKKMYDKYSNFLGRMNIEKFDTCDEFLSWIKKIPKKINVANLIPHGNLHIKVMRDSIQEPNSTQTEDICRVLGDALDHGFFGLSFGLIYPPGSYLRKDSPFFYALGNTLYRHKGVLAVHIRDEMAGVFESVEEILKIGLQTKCAVELSHIKLANKFDWGRAPELITLIESYIQRGTAVHMDAYPYDLAGNMLATTLMPPEFLMEQGEKIFEYLQSPIAKQKAVEFLQNKMQSMASTIKGPLKYLIKIVPPKKLVQILLKIMGKQMLILSALNEPELNGKTLAGIAQERHKDMLDTAFEMIIKNQCQVTIAPKVMSYKDVDRFIMHQRCMMGSDYLVIPGLKPHPRAYGSAARFLNRYVKEQQLISWEEGIRKMTSLPAQKFQIPHRGILQPGNIADIVVFDPRLIQDNATIENSTRFSTGFKYVFVKGQLSLQDDKILPGTFGDLLLKPT